MAKYRSKPQIEEFEAIEYTGDNDAEIIEFAKDAPNFKVLDGNLIVMAKPYLGWFLRKLDYIVKYPNGNVAVKIWEEINYRSELVE